MSQAEHDRLAATLAAMPTSEKEDTALLTETQGAAWLVRVYVCACVEEGGDACSAVRQG